VVPGTKWTSFSLVFAVPRCATKISAAAGDKLGWFVGALSVFRRRRTIPDGG